MMQHCLGDQVIDSLLIYLDDIIVYSPDFVTQLVHLEQVFEQLEWPEITTCQVSSFTATGQLPGPCCQRQRIGPLPGEI